MNESTFLNNRDFSQTFAEFDYVRLGVLGIMLYVCLNACIKTL